MTPAVMDTWQLLEVRGDDAVFLGRDPAGLSVASLVWRPLPAAERVHLGEPVFGPCASAGAALDAARAEIARRNRS